MRVGSEAREPLDLSAAGHLDHTNHRAAFGRRASACKARPLEISTVKFQLDSGTATYVIRAYGEGGVRVNDEVVTRSLVVTPEHLIRDWAPQRYDELQEGHFDFLNELEIEVLLLGTGSRLRFPQSRFLAALVEQGVGVEVMDTPAACRTYNILMSEGRQVAAALLIESPGRTGGHK